MNVNLRKSKFNLIMSLLLVFACVLSQSTLFGVDAFAAKAKSKAPALSAKSVTLTAGQSKKIKVKNSPKKAKTTWKSKNAKIATVNKKGKITAVVAGNTKVICTLKYKLKGKNVKKNLTVKVKVNAAAPAATTAAPATTSATKAPVTVPTQAPTVAPSLEPTPTTPVDPIFAPSTEEIYTQTNVGEEHESKGGRMTKDNGLMRKELSSLDLIHNAFGIGWNMGNQMEQSNYKGNMATVIEAESSAGNPRATQKTFDGLKMFGVNTVRIPVAWSNFMSDDYTIKPALMNRVEDIVNYALNNEMYVIINDHWDGGWWGMFGSPDENVRKNAWTKYEKMWTQIADRFSEYSDHLIFEAGNEELSSAFEGTGNRGLNTRVGEDGFYNENGPEGTLTEDEIYETAFEISQKFVDIVRASGGNNTYRHLLIPGNTTGIDKAIDDRFKMPVDIEENGVSKLSVDVHIYDPTPYGLSATSNESYGYRESWGTDEDREWLRNHVAKIKKFTDQGYGVIAGECGVVKGYKDNIIDYLRYYFELCKEFSVTPVLWDEGHYYNRQDGYFQYIDVGDLISKFTASEYTLPEGAETKTTGVPVIPTVANPNPKVCYTWTGEFMRHTNMISGQELAALRPDDIVVNEYGEAGIAKTETISDGMEAEFDPEWWNIHLTCDWSTIEEPCIKVYPMDNEASINADLQLGFMETNKSGVKFDVDYDPGTNNHWGGKYIKLDKDLVTKYPWIWVTTNTYTGASYVKIEFCDGAYNADGTPFTN